MYSLWISWILASSMSWSHISAVLYQGNVSTFNALKDISSGGNVEVSATYSTCVCYDRYGNVVSTGVQCVSTLFNYMLQAMASAAEGSTVADASSGTGMVQEVSLGTIGRRNSNNDSVIIDAVNTALAHHSSALRATRLTDSNIHPHDGFAAEMNVFGSNDTALLVHTNGTHASASFQSGTSLRPRYFLPTLSQYFTFNGVDGLKMQAQEINGTSTPAYISDLQSFASQFANIASGNNEPAFRSSDSWDYEVCDKSGDPLFYGKVIAEKSRPGDNYEDIRSIGCTATNRQSMTLISTGTTTSSGATTTTSTSVTSTTEASSAS